MTKTYTLIGVSNEKEDFSVPFDKKTGKAAAKMLNHAGRDACYMLMDKTRRFPYESHRHLDELEIGDKIIIGDKTYEICNIEGKPQLKEEVK